MDEFWICATCGVEHADVSDVCAICADERQWVPADGTRWTTLSELAREGRRIVIEEVEPDLHEITADPGVGIGQHAQLVRTPDGNLLWDPPGFIDDQAVQRIRELGELRAIAASHPHMFGVQVQWSRALGGVPVLVAEADASWIARPDPAIELWSDRHDVAPGLTLLQLGGHFPGSAVAYWTAGAEGRGVMLVSDTIHANPDRSTVTFLRSYPNRIPLSAAVVQRIRSAVQPLAFDRLYGSFGRTIASDAHAAVRLSADRYCAWVRGDFDHLT